MLVGTDEATLGFAFRMDSPFAFGTASYADWNPPFCGGVSDLDHYGLCAIADLASFACR